MAPRHILTFASLLGLFLFVIVHNVSPEPYGYDEADYMYAASLGFGANWSDTPSTTLADFVHARRGERQALSTGIRASGDVLFYRHFHGPLFHYLLIPISRLGWSEAGVRTALLAIPCVTLAVLYFGCLWLGAGALVAALVSVLYLSSYAVVASTELGPHHLFVLCSVASLILMMKAVGTGRRSCWYCSFVAAALAFCTLEVAWVLLLTLAICCFVQRLDLKSILISAAIFICSVLTLWPAAILRLSFAKAYAVMAHYAIYSAAAWGDVGFVQTWRDRFLNSPVEWMFIAAGTVILLVRRNSKLYPLGIFAALMIAATLRIFTATPRYALPFIVALDLLAGLALVPLIGPLRRPASFAVVVLAVAGLYGNAFYRVLRRPHSANPRSAAVLTFIYQNHLQNKAVLAPQADLPTLHYYFRGMRLRGYLGDRPLLADAAFLPDGVIPARIP